MQLRLIDLYHQDLSDQTTTEAKQVARRYWYRAVGLTIMERGISFIAVPKRGTHGVRVERYLPFWNHAPDEELDDLFMLLKPYFQTAQRKTINLDDDT